MILSYRTNRYGNLDTLNSKICPLFQNLVNLYNKSLFQFLFCPLAEYEEILEDREISEGTKKGKKTPNLKTKNTSLKKKQKNIHVISKFTCILFIYILSCDFIVYGIKKKLLLAKKYLGCSAPPFQLILRAERPFGPC